VVVLVLDELPIVDEVPMVVAVDPPLPAAPLVELVEDDPDAVTAYHTPPNPWPVMSPGLLSPA
jgi:hypothetical protein